jgi:glyoxylase-like metal-dependent hydrolase (beta-lactamase superfamily II)
MRFGDTELFLVEDGPFRLDGGAMYGIVPKVMWGRDDPTDDRNRIDMAANLLLIRTGEHNVLVDTGCGGKWDDKGRDMFAIGEPRTMVTDLARIGVHPEEITHVILSHLHFDHAGGNTYINQDGELKVQFPNARHIVQRGEWEVALNPLARDRRSYLPENLRPLEDEGVLELVEGDTEVLPGISMRVTGGHTEHHAAVQVQSGGLTCVFCADLIPRATHVPLNYVMAYDLYPVQTLAFKEAFLREALENRYLLLFEHDPRVPAGHLVEDDRGRLGVEPFDMETDQYTKPG